MAEFGWFLFSSGGAIAALGLGAVWLLSQPSSKYARRFLAGSAVFYGLAGSHAVGSSLMRLAGAGFAPLQRADIPRGRTVVVVLGSGAFTVRGWDDRAMSFLDLSAAARVLEGARLYALADAEWVIASGGAVDPEDGNDSTGVTMREALIRLGVPAERIRSDTRSRNTYDEAVSVAPVLRSLGAEQVVLVTSRVHMRRAAGAFRAQGIPVIPAVARDYDFRLPWPMWVIPTETGMWESSVAVHEFAGLAYYTLLGRHRVTP